MKSTICLNSRVTFTFMFLVIIGIIVIAIIVVPMLILITKQKKNKKVITTTKEIPPPVRIIRNIVHSGDYLPSIGSQRFGSESYNGRGYPHSFGINESSGLGIQRGVLNHDSNEEYKLPLYGDREYPGSREYEYVVLDHTIHQNRIELGQRRDVITDGEKIQVPGYPGTFTTHLYENQGPRYNPTVIY
jgi:hypothetical protein